jgi:hypothetical protein
VDFYDKGGIPNKNLNQRRAKLNLLDVKLNLSDAKLNLSDQDKKDLVAFLQALDGEPSHLTIPTEFPQ